MAPDSELCVLTIIDGSTIHRIPHDEVRFVTFTGAFVLYQLVGQPQREIRFMVGVAGINGHHLAELIGTGKFGGTIYRHSETIAFEVKT